MGKIVARFADGRFLVQEEKLAEQGYKMSGYSTVGVPFRIGHVKTVEQILTLEANVSGYGGELGSLVAPAKEALISGDTLLVILRRCDLGSPTMTGTGTATISGVVASGIWSGIISGHGAVISGYATTTVTVTGPIGSGSAALGALSGITSGLAQYGELTSGLTLISGKVNIRANVIGF